MFQQERKGSMNTRVCAVFLHHAETPAALIMTPKATITYNTFRHCRVCLHALIGQPFPKQLYYIYICLFRK